MLVFGNFCARKDNGNVMRSREGELHCVGMMFYDFIDVVMESFEDSLPLSSGLP